MTQQIVAGCAHCYFARPSHTPELLQCHRYPPVPVKVNHPITQEPAMQMILPMVHPQNFCGEFAMPQRQEIQQ